MPAVPYKDLAGARGAESSETIRHRVFTLIYSGNIVQADLLKCLLEGDGIQAFLEDEFLGRMVPYAATPGGTGAVKVIIATSDLDQAPKNC